MSTPQILGTVLFFSSLILMLAAFVLEGKLTEAMCESLSLLSAVVSFNLLSAKKQVK